MTYAFIINGTIESEHGRLPSGARRLDTGAWITPLDRQWSQAEHEACGFIAVVDTARPNDTAQDTYVRSVTLPGGVPTVTWTARPWTQAELAARAAEVNRTTLGARVQPHIDALKLIKNSTGTLTGLQLSNAVRALAAAQLDTLRFLHSRLDALD